MIALKFVPVFGTSHSESEMKNSTLVIPTMSAGLNAIIAVDLYILNEGMTKLGYIKSHYISPVI